MTRVLEQLRIDEVSAVDAAANEDARVLLLKRDDRLALEKQILDATDSLRLSLESIETDPALGPIEKGCCAALSTDQFLQHVSDLIQGAVDVAKGAIGEPVTKKEPTHMPTEAEIFFIKKAVGHDLLMEKAHELRKSHPNLSIEQCYEKALTAPANRPAALAALGKVDPTARFLTGSEISEQYMRQGSNTAAAVVDPHVTLLALADEQRKANPKLSKEQAYAAAQRANPTLGFGMHTLASRGRATERSDGSVDSSRT